MLCHARYSLAPDADNAVYSADGVIAQKGKEAGVLAIFFGQIVVVHGHFQGPAGSRGSWFWWFRPQSLAKPLVELFAGKK